MNKPACVLKFHVIPNARQIRFCGMQDNALKIKLRAPALEGKANAALLDFLSEVLHLKKHAFTLLRGVKSQNKEVEVAGLTREEVIERLSKIASD